MQFSSPIMSGHHPVRIAEPEGFEQSYNTENTRKERPQSYSPYTYTPERQQRQHTVSRKPVPNINRYSLPAHPIQSPQTIMQHCNTGYPQAFPTSSVPCAHPAQQEIPRVNQDIPSLHDQANAVLPCGWKSHCDSRTQRHYYVEEATGNAQWEHPSFVHLQKQQQTRPRAQSQAVPPPKPMKPAEYLNTGLSRAASAPRVPKASLPYPLDDSAFLLPAATPPPQRRLRQSRSSGVFLPRVLEAGPQQLERPVSISRKPFLPSRSSTAEIPCVLKPGPTGCSSTAASDFVQKTATPPPQSSTSTNVYRRRVYSTSTATQPIITASMVPPAPETSAAQYTAWRPELKEILSPDTDITVAPLMPRRPSPPQKATSPPQQPATPINRKSLPSTRTLIPKTPATSAPVELPVAEPVELPAAEPVLPPTAVELPASPLRATKPKLGLSIPVGSTASVIEIRPGEVAEEIVGLTPQDAAMVEELLSTAINSPELARSQTMRNIKPALITHGTIKMRSAEIQVEEATPIVESEKHSAISIVESLGSGSGFSSPEKDVNSNKLPPPLPPKTPSLQVLTEQILSSKALRQKVALALRRNPSRASMPMLQRRLSTASSNYSDTSPTADSPSSVLPTPAAYKANEYSIQRTHSPAPSESNTMDHLEVFKLLQRSLTLCSYVDEFSQRDADEMTVAEFTDEYEEVAGVADDSYRELVAKDVEEWLRINGAQ